MTSVLDKIENEDEKKKVLVSFNENGFMDTKSFLSYIDHFVNYKPPHLKFVVLFYDQHITHMAFEVLEKWRQHKVYVIATIQNLTQLSSVLDDNCFRSLKAGK